MFTRLRVFLAWLFWYNQWLWGVVVLGIGIVLLLLLHWLAQ